MDEPTNAMDQLSEARLIANLKSYIEDKTAIFVTQKNTLLEMVDRIIVMHEGQIYLDGPKHEVLAKLSGKSLLVRSFHLMHVIMLLCVVSLLPF